MIFPREPHSLRTEPRHAVDVLKWQIYWFERYMEGNPSAVKPTVETKDAVVNNTAGRGPASVN